MQIGEIFISSLKIMGDCVGNIIPTVENLKYFESEDIYGDRLNAMRETINRGLQRADKNIFLPINLDYTADIKSFNMTEDLAILLPFYVKYELYQNDNMQQALYALKDYDDAINDIKTQSTNTILNVFEEAYE